MSNFAVEPRYDIKVELPSETVAYSIWRVNMALLRHFDPAAADGQWNAEAWKHANLWQSIAYTHCNGLSVVDLIESWVHAVWENCP